MVFVFRLVYCCAAFLSFAAGALVIATFFMPDRAPQTFVFIGTNAAVGAVLVGVGILLFGIQRHVAGIAAIMRDHDDQTTHALAIHVDRLLAYLIAGGALLTSVLGLVTYVILARIDQGFAVFG
jgi:hypothetical protein